MPLELAVYAVKVQVVGEGGGAEPLACPSLQLNLQIKIYKRRGKRLIMYGAMAKSKLNLPYVQNMGIL